MTALYSADWVLPVEGTPVERGGVAIEDGRIAAVRPADELDGEHVHFDGAVILPGFVNAHTHLEYAVYAGFGDGLALGPWLDVHVERKRRIDWEGAVAIARLGAAESLASGVTTVADASFSGAGAVAAAELGLRAVVYLEVFGRDAATGLQRFSELEARVRDAASERVRLGVSPHAPYTASAELYAAALELGLPVSTHLAESEDELAFMLCGTGPIARIAELAGVGHPGESSVRHLARHGLLRSGMLAAHCVNADAEEIELLARSGVAVAHCPRSNALLGCGVAPLAELLAAGVRVGLGTDSPASAPTFDLFDEMRAAIMAARARVGRADALSAAEALRLATLGSAEALGLAAEVGSLTPGKRADLAVVSLAGTAYVPWEDPVAAVVFRGSSDRVLRTIVGGESRYERGGDEWEKLRRDAAVARGRLLGRQPAREPVGQKRT